MTAFDHIPLMERRLLVRDSVFKHGPARFDMAYWFITGHGTGDAEVDAAASIDIDACGTTGCIAGHVALVALAAGCRVYNPHQASDWLGIEREGLDGHHPFSCTYWPTEMEDEPDKQGTFDAVVDWLDDLIIEAGLS